MRFLIRQIARLIIRGRFYPQSLEAIVASLLVLLVLSVIVPAILVRREQARQYELMERLKLVGLGMHAYHDTFRSFPVDPHKRLDVATSPPVSSANRKSRQPSPPEPEAISPL